MGIEESDGKCKVESDLGGDMEMCVWCLKLMRARSRVNGCRSDVGWSCILDYMNAGEGRDAIKQGLRDDGTTTRHGSWGNGNVEPDRWQVALGNIKDAVALGAVVSALEQHPVIILFHHRGLVDVAKVSSQVHPLVGSEVLQRERHLGFRVFAGLT